MHPHLKTARDFLDLVIARFIDVRGQSVAASLTFTTLLALVPLLTVSLVLFSNFPVFDALGAGLRGFLLDNLLPQKAGEVIAKYSLQFSQKAGQLTLLGLLILVVTVGMTMLTIDRAFNSIFHVARPARAMRRMLVYWMVVTLGPLALGASVALVSYLVSASLGLVNEPSWLRLALIRTLPYVILGTLLTLLYVAVPNRRIRARDALAGAVAATVLFALVQRLFGLYIAKFPTYTLIYGAFAALPIFLLWLYLSWVVVLVGAVVTAVLPEFLWGSRVAPPYAGRNTFGALLVLRELGLAQRYGHARAAYSLAVSSRLSEAECEQLLEQLRAASWIARDENGDWLLASRLEDIRVRDVFERFAFSPRCVPTDTQDDVMAQRLLALHEHAADRLSLPLADLFA